MKASEFGDAQKAFIPKQGEQGAPSAEICRKAGISRATYFDRKRSTRVRPRRRRVSPGRSSSIISRLRPTLGVRTFVSKIPLSDALADRRRQRSVDPELCR